MFISSPPKSILLLKYDTCGEKFVCVCVCVYIQVIPDFIVSPDSWNYRHPQTSPRYLTLSLCQLNNSQALVNTVTRNCRLVKPKQ